MSCNMLNGKGAVRWAMREESLDPVDNGWRFLSDVDTDEHLADAANVKVCDFNTVAGIEPALLGIYHLSVGADLQLAEVDGRKVFYDNATSEELVYSDGRFEYR